MEKVTIMDVAAEGKAIAKVNDLVIFVPYVVPGDVVDLQIKRKKNKYAEAEAVKFHELSPNRAVPFCQHYGVCGGCKWQVLPYSEQIRYKQKQVEDNLRRIGKIELPEISPILGSDKTEFYRNKLEFTFSNKRWLTNEEVRQDVKYDQMNAVGFHIPGAFDKVLAIEKCWLQDDISNRIRNAVRDYAYEHDYSFINLRTQEGMLRNMIVRTSSTGELMVIVICKITEDHEMELFKQLLQFVADSFPEITSLLYIINNKCNDTINDLDVHVFKGKDHIFEEMEGLCFKVGPKSFYQTNSEQAYNLYKVAREFAGLTGNELVYDLYTGTGTIANFVSRQARQVIGIEYVPEAIEDAKVNAEINDIKNALFYAGDMKDILTQDFINQHGRPDVIITDPPRAGMHQDVVDVILFAEPKRIVYVSCNPATQARDLQLLDEKYKVKAIQPVDMFPHTHHVENVVLLELRQSVMIIEFQKKKEMGKRPRRTPAEKARAQYTNYAVKEPMELMEFLAAKMPDASRTKLKSLLSKRVVFVDNVITTQFNFPLEAGMKVQISKQKGKKEFNNRLLKIVYEDAYIIVVEKMQGLLSVNTERQKERTAYTILNEYVQRSGRQFRVFIVHRLDRDTSGLMMFAKDEKTQRTLRDNWHDIVTDRRYVAVVEGSMEKDYDTVVSWLTDKTLYVSSSEYDDGGSKSITHYKTIKRANGYSLLELDLETGRKNQIRVHMQDLGHPIIGDGRYGREDAPNPIGRLALHAFKLCFYHPVTGDLMEFETPYPAEFKKLFLKK